MTYFRSLNSDRAETIEKVKLWLKSKCAGCYVWNLIWIVFYCEVVRPLVA